MDSIYLENYRCFKKGREVPLAPLTLLVGENKTGKTSFMAMIQALGDMVYGREELNFNKAPYDLGNFHETIHHDGGKSKSKQKFMAGFEINGKHPKDAMSLRITFAEQHGMPAPVEVKIANAQAWCHVKRMRKGWGLRLGTENGSWRVRPSALSSMPTLSDDHYSLDGAVFLLATVHLSMNKEFAVNDWRPGNGGDAPSDKDVRQIKKLASDFEVEHRANPTDILSMAPIRSEPHRVYAPSPIIRDPEGSSMPSYLAEIFHQGGEKWGCLKRTLETYGQSAGLFDEISVHHLGKEQGAPFQIRVRKHRKRIKGPWRNLADAGQGISQVLPIIVELSQLNSTTYLLQEPESYLHPRAQAALGTFFFDTVAASKPQIIVETHSDYLLDRIRMEVRENSVKPENVLILYFEQVDKDVAIHPLSLNERGKIIDPPPSYGEFFMNEIHRSFGFR